MSFTDLYMSGSPLIDGAGREGARTAVFGIPFDSTHSYRPGARFGPDAIRGAFNNIEVFHPDLGVDLESVPVADLGNMTHTVAADRMLEMAGRVASELAGRYEQVVALGGEHLVTLGTYGALPRGTGYVVFDAHYDLRDGYAGAGLSHASYLRRIVEQRGADGMLHVGARACAGEELEFLREHRIRTVSDRDIRRGDGPRMIRDAASTLDSAYVSFDLDVLDPAFAPGVGNPEAAGVTSRELFDMILPLGETRIAGADIVELCPAYDNGATSAAAAKILSCVIALGSCRQGQPLI